VCEREREREREREEGEEEGKGLINYVALVSEERRTCALAAV
jgi:hypothetical protein